MVLAVFGLLGVVGIWAAAQVTHAYPVFACTIWMFSVHRHGYLCMWLQMFINLGQAFVAIALCTSVFLTHPAPALIVTATVAIVEVELAGMCWVLGIQVKGYISCSCSIV